jgi:hypothetical protein
VTDPEGRRTADIRYEPDGTHAIGYQRVDAGATYTHQLVLDDWFDFKAPGRYHVEVRMVGPFETEAGHAPSDMSDPTCLAALRSLVESKVARSSDYAVVAARALTRMATAEAVDVLIWAMEHGRLVHGIDRDELSRELARAPAGGSESGLLI